MSRILQWQRQYRRREASSKNNKANEKVKVNSKNTYDRYLLVDSYMRWSNTNGSSFWGGGADSHEQNQEIKRFLGPLTGLGADNEWYIYLDMGR